MKKGKKLYEGKAKIIYATQDKDLVIQYFKDDATAFNNQKKTTIEGKGVLNNRISEHILSNLSQIGIENHFVKRLNMREQIIKLVEIIPIEVVVRNIADGSIVRQTTIPKDVRFCPPLIEFYLKDDSKNDPLLTEDRMEIMGYRNIYRLKQYAKETNAVVSNLFSKIGITLVDFKIEFGVTTAGDIVVADEISPDGCRLRNANGQSMDKDLFRNEKGDIISAYQEILDNLKK